VVKADGRHSYELVAFPDGVRARRDSGDRVIGPVGEPIELARTQCFKLAVHVPFEGDLMDTLTPGRGK
jgi:hypothetical protein